MQYCMAKRNAHILVRKQELKRPLRRSWCKCDDNNIKMHLREMDCVCSWLIWLRTGPCDGLPRNDTDSRGVVVCTFVTPSAQRRIILAQNFRDFPQSQPGQYLKTGQDRFLWWNSQFIIHNHRAIRRHVTCPVDEMHLHNQRNKLQSNPSDL
jgi:hypothetical protein